MRSQSPGELRCSCTCHPNVVCVHQHAKDMTHDFAYAGRGGHPVPGGSVPLRSPSGSSMRCAWGCTRREQPLSGPCLVMHICTSGKLQVIENVNMPRVCKTLHTVTQIMMHYEQTRIRLLAIDISTLNARHDNGLVKPTTILISRSITHNPSRQQGKAP